MEKKCMKSVKGVDKIKRNTLKSRMLELVNGWECLENNLKSLPTDHPMRIVVPAISACREQLDKSIKGKKVEKLNLVQEA
jgi:glutamyl-tRNA reductase